MSHDEKAQEIVFAAIDEVNGMLGKDKQIPKDLAAILYGNNAIIPSLMVMNLVVAVEEQAEDEHDLEISLKEVFHTTADLIKQVARLVAEEEG